MHANIPTCSDRGGRKFINRCVCGKENRKGDATNNFYILLAFLRRLQRAACCLKYFRHQINYYNSYNIGNQNFMVDTTTNKSVEREKKKK